jgi:hypothetical protein
VQEWVDFDFELRLFVFPEAGWQPPAVLKPLHFEYTSWDPPTNAPGAFHKVAFPRGAPSPGPGYEVMSHKPEENTSWPRAKGAARAGHWRKGPRTLVERRAGTRGSPRAGVPGGTRSTLV